MIRLDFLTPQNLCSLYHILLNHCVVQQCVQGAQKVFKERSKVSIMQSISLLRPEQMCCDKGNTVLSINCHGQQWTLNTQIVLNIYLQIL